MMIKEVKITVRINDKGVIFISTGDLEDELGIVTDKTAHWSRLVRDFRADDDIAVKVVRTVNRKD